jgi:glutamine amidotransferase
VNAGRIAVCDYGIGNLASAHKALVHLGADAVLTTDPGVVDDAAAVVVPGVGNFGACARALRASGLEAPVRAAVGDGRPVLGICVGLQLLFDASDEDDGRDPGLGVIGGRVRRLPESERLPQIGWNTVEVVPRSRLFEGLDAPWMYFVHSYAPVPDDPNVVTGWCTYGTRFACAVERDNVWAVQFHPEKSGTNGLRLLDNFVRACTSVATAH